MRVKCIFQCLSYIGTDVFLGELYDVTLLTGIYKNLYWVEIPKRSTMILAPVDYFITLDEQRDELLLSILDEKA
jgi:hypothetical protein